MSAPKITFLPAFSTSNLQSRLLACATADMLEFRQKGLWLREAFPLHHSDGQSFGLCAHKEQNHTAFFCLNQPNSCQTLRQRQYSVCVCLCLVVSHVCNVM